MSPKVGISLACWPGLRHEDAARHLATPPAEPCFGRLSTEHVQLVPQSMGRLDEALVDLLREAFPATRFRLHANVRVLARHVMADLSNFAMHTGWFSQAARISQRLDAPAYTAHAGRRSQARLDEVAPSLPGLGPARAVQHGRLSAQLAALQQQPDLARQRADAATQRAESDLPGGHPERQRLQLLQARLALARGDKARARSLLQALAPQLDGQEPAAPLRQQAQDLQRRLAIVAATP